MTTDLLVSAGWLAQHLHDPNVRPVDVRWYLTEPGRGRSEYTEGHIAGAPYLSLDDDMAERPAGDRGRHPLPTPERFAQAVGRAGIGPDTHVVAYDSSGGAYAARLWWLLRYFGHERVSLLDGGWQAWEAGGHPTERGETSVEPASFTPRPHPEMVLDTPAVEALLGQPGVLLLDARASERYEGRVEPIDPRAGHIPGARSAPYAGNLAADGSMQSPEVLRERYTALGADSAERVVAYCGSGVTAAHDVFALHLAGLPGAQLYEGSWSGWSSDPKRPIATGSEPG